MYIGWFHLQQQISKICTGLHTIFTNAQEACTQGFVSPCRSKTHTFGYSPKSHEKFTDRSVNDQTLTTQNRMYRCTGCTTITGRKGGNGTTLACIVLSARSLMSEGIKDKKKM